MKVIYICSIDAAYIEYVGDCVKEVMPDAEIITCKSRAVLYERIRKYSELFIVCDTLFLGFNLTLPLHFIKWNLCESAKVMITAWHALDFFLGVRVKNLEYDGFINNIGDKENLKKALTEFFKKGTYFDDEVNTEYLNKSINRYTKYVKDIHTDDIDTVLTVRKFGNSKSRKNGKYDSNAYNCVSNIKKKLGIETDAELDEIIQQAKLGGII